MTDHLHATLLDELAANEPFQPGLNVSREYLAAMASGAAALRALAQFRPHHPAVVVSDVYAVLHVSHAAMMAARDVLGDFDLGKFDLKAAQAETARQRQAHFDTLTSDEIRAKWGR